MILRTVDICVLLSSERLTGFVHKRTAARGENNVVGHNTPQENFKIPEHKDKPIVTNTHVLHTVIRTIFSCRLGEFV